MTTKLDKTIKREIEIDGQAYTVAISPDGVKLTQKGFRKGQEVTWQQLLAAGGGAEGGTPGGAPGASPGASPGSSAGNAGSGARSGVDAIDLHGSGMGRGPGM